MLKFITDVSMNSVDRDQIIGGQIWMLDKSVDLGKIKNLLNIIGL